MKFGELIGEIISKIVLAMLFFLIFTPISITLKLMNKSPLDKNINKKADSYWITRVSQPQSMENQF